jgi:hypothetical protein
MSSGQVSSYSLTTSPTSMPMAASWAVTWSMPLPPTSGSATGGWPDETTRVTASPSVSLVSMAGSWLMTSPAAMVSDDWGTWVTTRPRASSSV